jgi:predicted acyl esterase
MDAVSIVAACAALSACLAIPPTAAAVITQVFNDTATPVPCMAQSDGVRVCDEAAFVPPRTRSTVKSFDGVPIDVRVAFPAQSVPAPDGPYPLIMVFTRYGGEKLPLSRISGWLARGYATLTMTDRGFGESCGTAAARNADAGCARGFVRMMDTRYEVRDAQELAGQLVDEGLVDPQRIGAIGNSYGGAAAIALAALKDRKMLPDGTLTPWTSPHGIPIALAGAASETGWTDLVASLVPNGSTLDYVEDAPYRGRTGVLKQSWENALYAVGQPFFYAPAGADPSADLAGWHTLLNTAKSYEDLSGNALPWVTALRDEVTAFHSAYYIDDSETPAPMLMSNGFTDDLIPADEAIRFYNRTRSRHPDARISLFLADIGHARGQHKVADVDLLQDRQVAWLEHYVTGAGGVPFEGVQALTQTCPSAVASGGPYFGANWAAIAPGEVSIDEAATTRISPGAGSPSVAQTFDPLAGGGACATAPAADQAGTATYRSAPVPTGGYTLMGSPTVIAGITARDADSQIAARLLDVDPDTGAETLVARGLWRPAVSSGPVEQVFQLHPNGYRFAPGHIVKLELLPNDNPSYGRVSEGQGEVRLSGLQLRLPVLEAPGSLGGFVHSPAAKVVPVGYALARDFTVDGYPRPKGATPVSVSLVPAFRPCVTPDASHGAPLSFGACRGPVQASPRLTVGTPDANGLSATSVGLAEFAVLPDDPLTPGDEADVRITTSITDVRRADNLRDYTGELEGSSSLRITDRSNGAAGDAATVVDVPLRGSLQCAKTGGGAGQGATCSVVTTADAIAPGTVLSGKRAVWELGTVELYDGGPDGLAATTDGNDLFARQGLFIP